MGYDEYHWEELYLTGGLNKLLVEDLNKYFNHQDIDNKAHKLKREKLQIIHLLEETEKKPNATHVTGRQIVQSLSEPLQKVIVKVGMT